MLNSEMLLDAISGLDDTYILKADRMLGYRNAGNAKGRKLGRTLLIAAIITALLTVAAVAVGISINKRHQQEINERLNIDGNQAENYTEYELPESVEPGLTVLSSKYDGNTYTIYADYSPVSMEELIMIASPQDYYTFTINWSYWIEGSAGTNVPSIYLKDWSFAEGKAFDPELKMQELISQAYDEESKSLRLELCFSSEAVDDKMTVYFGPAADIDSRNLESEKVCSVSFTPAEYNAETLYFPEPVSIIEQESGTDFTFLGAELSSTGCKWLIKSSLNESVHTRPGDNASPEEIREYQDNLADWINAMERIERAAKLELFDGTEIALGAANTTEYIGDIVKPNCSWDNMTVNVNEVESIILDGVTVKISDCSNVP